jgi:hypothetical protein
LPVAYLRGIEKPVEQVSETPSAFTQCVALSLHCFYTALLVSSFWKRLSVGLQVIARLSAEELEAHLPSILPELFEQFGSPFPDIRKVGCTRVPCANCIEADDSRRSGNFLRFSRGRGVSGSSIFCMLLQLPSFWTRVSDTPDFFQTVDTRCYIRSATSPLQIARMTSKFPTDAACPKYLSICVQFILTALSTCFLQAVVLCLVEMYMTMGNDLIPHLAQLSDMQRRLVSIYAKKISEVSIAQPSRSARFCNGAVRSVSLKYAVPLWYKGILLIGFRTVHVIRVSLCRTSCNRSVLDGLL